MILQDLFELLPKGTFVFIREISSGNEILLAYGNKDKIKIPITDFGFEVRGLKPIQYFPIKFRFYTRPALVIYVKEII